MDACKDRKFGVHGLYSRKRFLVFLVLDQEVDAKTGHRLVRICSGLFNPVLSLFELVRFHKGNYFVDLHELFLLLR